MSAAENNMDDRKLGMDALLAVANHREGQKVIALEKENEMLNAIQLKTAVYQDIFYYFDKINNPDDPTTIDTLKEYRDYIVENCVYIQMPNVAPDGVGCRFSTVGGYHPFTSAVLMACKHYDKAIEEHGELNIQPMHWQWDESKEVAAICGKECLSYEHMHVEAHESKETRYLNMEGFPLKWVAKAVQKENVCASCGAESEQLKACSACRLVKYCNRDCQQKHRHEHKTECKRRAATLQRDLGFREQFGSSAIPSHTPEITHQFAQMGEMDHMFRG